MQLLTVLAVKAKFLTALDWQVLLYFQELSPKLLTAAKLIVFQTSYLIHSCTYPPNKFVSVSDVRISIPILIM